MIPSAQQYAQTQVQTASSVQVIVLLYDGVIQSLKLAKEGILSNNFPEKARFLDRSLLVVGELSAALDMDRGGEIALDLRSLYEYVQYELTRANIQHDSSCLDGPIRCLSVLREAWQELARRGSDVQAVGA